jgi:putative cell wall-binding protein
VSSIRATKRCAAAAAGVGMVLASFAGAAASATASASHHVNSARVHPDVITTPSGAFAVAAESTINNPLAPVSGGVTTPTPSVTLPTVQISDPNELFTNGTVVTLTLDGAGIAGAALSGAPVVSTTGSATGISVTGSSRTATAISFTVGATSTGLAALYTISGLTISGSTAPGLMSLVVTAVPTTGSITVPTGENTIHVGATTRVAVAAAGAEAPDTAAVLFRAAFTTVTTPTSLVVASDYIPQDAESANYLAAKLGTGVLITDPGTLSSAVSSVLTTYTNITHIYIVGGTSVVSSGVQTALAAAIASRTTPQVIRYSGTTQYDTNQAILTAVATGFPGVTPTVTPVASTNVALPFVSDALYNTSGGASSPTTVATAQAKTAIVVSGDIDSYQDGVAASALSYGDGVPIVLTSPTALSASALAALSYGGYTQVLVLGGPLAVSDSVVSSLTASNINVLRVAGHDASETASLLATLELTAAGVSGGTHTTTGLVFSATDGTGPLLARGNGFQDALAAGAYAGGHTNSGTDYTPILLSENATVLGGSSTSGLTAYLKAQGTLGDFTIQPLGGASSVTPTLTTAATNAMVSGIPTP